MSHGLIKYNVTLQNADAVLEAFRSSKLDDLKSSKKKLNQKRSLDTDAFFAKYLTSERVCLSEGCFLL